jgi:hypothetical protein
LTYYNNIIKYVKYVTSAQTVAMILRELTVEEMLNAALACRRWWIIGSPPPPDHMFHIPVVDHQRETRFPFTGCSGLNHHKRYAHRLHSARRAQVLEGQRIAEERLLQEALQQTRCHRLYKFALGTRSFSTFPLTLLKFIYAPLTVLLQQVWKILLTSPAHAGVWCCSVFWSSSQFLLLSFSQSSSSSLVYDVLVVLASYCINCPSIELPPVFSSTFVDARPGQTGTEPALPLRFAFLYILTANFTSLLSNPSSKATAFEIN